MAKSGLTFEASKGGNLAHNNREHKIDYLIDGDFFCDKTEAQALSYLAELKIEAQKNYTTRTKQKMQIDIDDPKYLWSATVNLNSEHTLQDIQNLAKEFEQKFGWQAIQIAVHRDEGKPDGTRKNLHAHIEFFMVSKAGISCFKKKDFRAKDMSELQTFVADKLKMERGEIYKETGNFKKHLKPNAFKAQEREKEALQAELQKQKELVLEKEKEQQYNFREYQAKITALKTENIDLKKELHKLNTQVNKGQADVQMLEKRLENYKTLYTSANERADRAEAKEVIVEKIVKVEDTTKIKELEKTISELRQEKISSFQNEALKALEAKKEPEPIKDTPKEPIVQKTAPRSLIQELRDRADKHYELRPEPIYYPDNLIDKSWTFKDCMHWLWAQGEAKQAREERFAREREKILEPYKTWEATNKKLEKAWQKAIADEDKKREETKQEPKAKQEQALVLTQAQIAEAEVAKFNQEHEDEDEYQGYSR